MSSEYVGLHADINQAINDYQRKILTKEGLAATFRGINSRSRNAEIAWDEADELYFTMELYAREIGLEGI